MRLNIVVASLYISSEYLRFALNLTRGTPSRNFEGQEPRTGSIAETKIGVRQSEII